MRIQWALALVVWSFFVVGCASTRPKSAARTLVAASNMKHPPFSSWDEDGNAVGIEVDLVEAAAKKLGLKVQWVERPFGELLTAVESGEVDVAVSTIGITQERAQRVAFSEPYFSTHIVALVKNGESAARTLKKLDKARIGADRVTTSFEAAERRWPNATLIGEVDAGSSWPEMVASGRIDAFVVDASDQHRFEQSSGVKLRRIGVPLKVENFAVVVAKDAHELRRAVNAAIDATRIFGGS